LSVFMTHDSKAIILILKKDETSSIRGLFIDSTPECPYWIDCGVGLNYFRLAPRYIQRLSFSAHVSCWDWLTFLRVADHVPNRTLIMCTLNVQPMKRYHAKCLVECECWGHICVVVKELYSSNMGARRALMRCSPALVLKRDDNTTTK
jgi:hypothetical protein